MVTIIVVAAGTGNRFGSPVPKQFCQIEGRPVVMRAIDSLRRACPGARMIIALSEAEVERWRYLCNLHNFESPAITIGGATRWESVRNALLSCDYSSDDIVLVHDGARPFPTVEMIEVLIRALNDNDVQGAVPVVQVTDSLRELVDGGPESRSVDRSRLRAVQTPQAFRASLLKQAYELPYESSFTDDASVMAAAGYDRLVLTPGDPINIKITHPLDIAIAETILNAGEA